MYTCTDYITQGKYIYINQLVAACPSHTTSDANNICHQCSILGQFDFSVVCVLSCPENTYQDIAAKTCYDYKSNGNFLYNNNVVYSCSSGFQQNILTNICESFFSLGLYNSLGLCVNICSVKFFTDVTNLLCVDYISQNKYIHNNTLVNICPSGYTSIQDNICITCFTANLWNYNGVCTKDGCPSTWFSDTPTLMC